jgi:hypothetical protein
MEKVVPATPMVTPTKENTRIAKNMGGAYTSGMMDESTMECIVKTRNMERYVPVVYSTVC